MPVGERLVVMKITTGCRLYGASRRIAESGLNAALKADSSTEQQAQRPPCTVDFCCSDPPQPFEHPSEPLRFASRRPVTSVTALSKSIFHNEIVLTEGTWVRSHPEAAPIRSPGFRSQGPVFITYRRNHEESHLSCSGSLHLLCFLRSSQSLLGAGEDVYKAKCAGCHGADGKGTAAGLKMGAQAFSSPTVQKMSDAEMVDFIENGGPQKKATHAFANKGVERS